MPAALPLVAIGFIGAGALVAATATVTILGLTIGLGALLTGVGIALAAVSYLIAKKPGTIEPESSQRGSQLALDMDPRAPASIAYGRTATGGSLIYCEAYGNDNDLLTKITALSVGGPIEAIEDTFADQRKLTLTGDPNTAPAVVASVEGLASDSKLIKNYLRLRYVKGERSSSASTLTTYSGQSLPYTPGKASGIACVIANANYDQEAFASGFPNLVYVVKGVKCYDPRKDSTYPGGSGSHRSNNNSTWEFSENPYVQALNWLIGRWEGGKRVYGIGCAVSEIDIAAYVEGANVADTNGWKSGGVVVTSDDKFSVLASLLQAGGGKPVARGAQISCLVNTPRASLYTITDSDICGQVETQTTNSQRDRKNSIIPRYREEALYWEMTQGEAVTSSFYVTEDDGLREQEVSFPFVQKVTQAHQLAAYELVNSREMLTVKLSLKPKFLNVRVGDAVTLNTPSISINSQVFTCVDRGFDPSNSTVTLSLKSEATGKHDYALGRTATAPGTPGLNGYDPTKHSIPSSGAFTATGITVTDTLGNSIPAIRLSGSAPVTAAKIVVEIKMTSDPGNYQLYGEYTREATNEILILGLLPATEYSIRIRYKTARGTMTGSRTLTATSGSAAFSIENAFDLDTLDSVAFEGTGAYPTNPNDWAVIGNIVKRRRASPTGFNVSALTREVFPSGVMIRANVYLSSKDQAIGITEDSSFSSSGDDRNKIDYCWATISGTWRIYENGTSIGSYGSVNSRDAAYVTYSGGRVQYWLNGVVRREVTTTMGRAFRGAVSFQEISAGWKLIKMAPYADGWSLEAKTQNIDPATGRPYGAGFYNTNRSWGLRGLTELPAVSASVSSGTATVSFAAGGKLYGDDGAVITLPSASFPGLAVSTTYYFYRNLAAPDGSGSASYGYSTNIGDALSPSKIYLLYYTTPSSGGSGGGGGGYGGGGGGIDCVAFNAFVETAQGPVEAYSIAPGDELVTLNKRLCGTSYAHVEANRVGTNHCVRLVSESGISLTLALNTPMVTKSGGWIMAANASGYRVPVIDDGGFRFERIETVEYVGKRTVAKISASDTCYAAGDVPGRSILSHNIYNKP